MWRDWIHSPSEVNIVWEVEMVYICKWSCNTEFEIEIASQRVLVSDFLYLFVQLFSFLRIGAVLQLSFVSVKVLRMSFGNVAFISSLCPDLLHDLENVQIDFPRSIWEVIENFKNSVVISILYKSFLDWTLAVSHERSSLWVVPSYVRLQPG